MPFPVLRRALRTPLVAKIVGNVGWLFLNRILQLVCSLVVGLWLARYLGPANFGALNYALALTGLFSFFAAFGLKDIVVRDIVRAPDLAGVILGTSAVLHMIGALTAFLLLMVSINYLRPNDSMMHGIVAILGGVLLFKFSDLALYWFESEIQSKYIVWTQLVVLVSFSAIKVLLIVNDGSLLSFAWVSLAESAALATLLLLVFHARGFSITKLSFNSARALSLLRDSWPLALSSLAILVYMKTDQIMLGALLGDSEVGIFSAAVKISEVWYFIPAAVVSSVFPVILKHKFSERQLYSRQMQHLYDFLTAISLITAFLIAIFSEQIIRVLFGDQYMAAAEVLRVHAWAGVFVFIGVARSKWVVAEGLQLLDALFIACAAALNVAGNFYLIPRYGPVGAAVMTVVSQLASVQLFPLMHKKTREAAIMGFRSMNLVRAYRRFQMQYV